MPEPDVDRALDWLQHLYGSTTEGWINLFSVVAATGRRRVEWAPVGLLWQLSKHVKALGSKGDVWFGVAPRIERLDAGQRGGASMCASIPGLWLDVDIAGPAHKLPNLPVDRDAVRALIGRFPLQPTALVNSGHGLQVCWLFKDPFAAAATT